MKRRVTLHAELLVPREHQLVVLESFEDFLLKLKMTYEAEERE